MGSWEKEGPARESVERKTVEGECDPGWPGDVQGAADA